MERERGDDRELLGPLANARNGQMEQYKEAASGMRLVQYFDKGRMELADPATGKVTSGLLATELITGRLQIGDTTFETRVASTIPMAGDSDNTAPTYVQLGASSLVSATPARMGGFVTVQVQPDGSFMDGGGFAGVSMTPPITTYDTPTQHNVLGVFNDFRGRVGLTTVGYATSEPFRANLKVGGQSRTVYVQAFERRVLTYTASNPDAFKVEFGNIGQHYFQWRYAQIQSPVSAMPTRQMTGSTGGPDTATVQALIPPGLVVKTVQATDLNSDGQVQAIFTAEGMNGPGHIEAAGLLVQRGGKWVLDVITPTDFSDIATIEAFPKNANHPGFVLLSHHSCGANCNGGTHTVIRYDGNGMTTKVLDGADDRGNPTADATAGKVTLNAPLYRWSDPRCCPTYAYTQTWVWKGTNLVGDSLTLRASDSEAGKPLPDWLKTNGVPLFTFLGPLQAIDSRVSAAPLFADTVTVRDTAGMACSVRGADLAPAVRSLTAPEGVYLWPDGSGFKASVSVRSEAGSDPAKTTVGGCNLGGKGTGGYVLTIEGQQSGFRVTAMQAVAEIYKVLPDTAITVLAAI